MKIVRVTDNTHSQLLLLRKILNKKSLGDVIKELVEYYKEKNNVG